MVLDRYAAIAVSFSLALAAGAQSITLVSPGNVPVNGSSFLVHKGAYIAPAAGGPDMLFDYSAAAATSSSTYQWQDPADLPNGMQFPGAEYVLTNGGPDTVYYKETASGLERVGDAQTIFVGTTGYHGTTVYSNSVLELQLPCTYGATPWTDLFSGSYTVDGTTANRDGAINGEADAWGRLVMPGGADTVEVLRVRTHISELIPLNVGIPVDVSHKQNVSAFYPLWGKLPVLRIVSDTLSAMGIVQSVMFTEWLDASALGVQEQTAQPLDMHLFPNPATEQVTLVFASGAPGAFDVQVIDARGAIVRHEQTTGRTLDLDLSQWEAGLYQVVLTRSDGQHGIRPLVVTH